jgi:mRNA interferase RelE/StbE
LKDFIYKSRKVEIKKLKGRWKGKYRLRIGNIRVVFDINYDERTIYIVRAGYRGDVYK